MENLIKFMNIAIEEAKISLREGNHGFGSVIIRDNELIAKAHDQEETDFDSTSHAEINAIRIASKSIGKNLKGCILLSTHEPCPMCSTAIIWAGIDHIAYGYSIDESIREGRKRINLTCRELFDKAEKSVIIDSNVLNDQCKILYRQDVRNEIKRLRNITEDKLAYYNEESKNRRIEWFNKQKDSFTFINDELLMSAYRLLLCRFNINELEAPIVGYFDDRIVFHSKNFCPTLEACKILNYDTRHICKRYNENSTDILIKQINTRLEFNRNYEMLRPYSEYCEEMIVLKSDENNGI